MKIEVKMINDTACLRLNSAEIRKRLEDAGYIESEFSMGESGECIVTCRNIKGEKPRYICISNAMFDDNDPRTTWKGDRIDCGIDIEKFFEIVRFDDIW